MAGETTSLEEKRAARLMECLELILAAHRRTGDIIGQAQRSPRGQPEGWVLSCEAREEIRSAHEYIYQYVTFGRRTSDT